MRLWCFQCTHRTCPKLHSFYHHNPLSSWILQLGSKSTPAGQDRNTGMMWVLLIPCLQRLSPVTSAEVATPLTSFPPQPLSSQEPSSLPLDFWIAFPFASCSPSLLLSLPLRFSPEIVSKEAEVIMSLPCSEFLMPLNAGSSVRAWTLQLGSLSGPSVSSSSSLLG